MLLTDYWVISKRVNLIVYDLYMEKHIRNFFKYMPLKVFLEMYFPELQPWDVDSLAFDTKILGRSLNQVIRAKNRLRWIVGCMEVEQAYNSLNICEKIKFFCGSYSLFEDYSPVPICETIRKYYMSFPIVVKLINYIYNIDDVTTDWIIFFFLLISFYIIAWYEKDH